MDGSHRPNQPAPAAAAPPQPLTSAEEEAIKKNTDCVYFLASPLTCKKGSECEYRHSDSARLNPRDCWYWMNGNCLNPKCAFRHPPLDGLLGGQAPNPVEPFMPPVQPFMPPVQAAPPATQVPYFSNKPGVPCIFFQQGICLKGDRCPFLHGPNSLINKVPQKKGALPTTDVSSKKTFGGLEKCTQQKNSPQSNVLKTGELLPAAKPVAKEGPALAKNHFLADKNMAPVDNEPLKYKPTSVPPNGNLVGRPSQMQHQHGFDDPGSMHNKDEEISREASPGFDVLVDDELRDSDYYPVEDQYGGAGDHERNEYDIDPTGDYPIRDIDQDMYRDAHGYDSYGHYAWGEQRGASSERKSGRSSHSDRRYGNTGGSDQFDGSDLRHRLSSKHRRVNGLRSVISHDQNRERHVEEQSYRGSRRETNNLSSHESYGGNRLRGRIKMPGRSSSPTDVSEIRSDREMDRGRDRDRGRFSHGRPQVLPSHQGRLQDRIKGRVQEDLNYVGRRPLRGDMLSENNTNFAGPKSLAELKGKKGSEGNGQYSLGKRKHQMLGEHQESGGGNLSFEGPKPLQEILKRKKRASENEDYNQHERTTIIEPSSLHKNEADLAVQKEDFQPPSGNTLENKPADDLEIEDGMLPDEGADYQDGEGYDQQDGDYNYEQVDGEDVNIDEAENGYPDEDYPEDDDDDDFAKKMAVVFS